MTLAAKFSQTFTGELGDRKKSRTFRTKRTQLLSGTCSTKDFDLFMHGKLFCTCYLITAQDLFTREIWQWIKSVVNVVDADTGNFARAQGLRACSAMH